MAEDPEVLGVSVEIEIQKGGISSGERVHDMLMPRPIASAVWDAGWVNRSGRDGVGAAQEKDPVDCVEFSRTFLFQRPAHSALAIVLQCIRR